MRAKPMEPGDERNAAFEPEEHLLERLTPGLETGSRPGAHKEQASNAEDGHRLQPQVGKKLPTESLAERIRQRTREG